LSADLSLGTSLVRIQGLTALDAPALGLAIESPTGDAWLQLEGGKVSITHLGLEQDGVLIIERLNSGQLDFYARGAEFQGHFMVLGSVHLSAGKELTDTSLETRLELTIPETVAFRAKGDGSVPTKFTVRSREPWVLQDLRVKGLGFSRETAPEPGSISFESAIKEGTITLHDVSETVTLREDDRLLLTGAKGRVVSLRAAEGINVTFEGNTERIRIGPEGFEQDLAPSYLKYFYHQQSLAFFWSAVAFFWGILWSIRRTLFP
jgi:hypothetical protein